MIKQLQYLTGIILLSLVNQLSAQEQITLKLEDYHTVSVSGRIDVELIPSDAQEMTISSANGAPEEVNVKFDDGELKISIRPKFDKNDVLSIRLPYKSLDAIEASGGAVINSARDMEAEELFLGVSAGGKIELSLKAEIIEAKVSQVSDIILYGTAESQTVNVNTGGNYLAYELSCKDTYVKVSSGSQAKVTASRKIEATANSKGFIGYIGTPVSTYTKTSLGGEIASFAEKPAEDIL